jgi:hypothetical protein
MKSANKVIVIFSVMFIMALIPSMAHARSPIKGPVLYFNPLETGQKKGEPTWKNAGTAGGQVERGGGKPTLEAGSIEIPAIGLKADDAAWYTATKSETVFANEEDDKKAPVVHLENFTLGLLMRVNGPGFFQEHQVIGLQTTEKAALERTQSVRIWLDIGDKGKFQNVSVAQGAIQARHDFSNRRNKLTVGNNEWHWVHIVFESGKSVTTYLDGKEAAVNPTEVVWDLAHEMRYHGIFTTVLEEQTRTCNCSIAIYRVYDRVLSPDEIGKNVRASLAVDPAGKMATTWGKMKQGF